MSDKTVGIIGQKYEDRKTGKSGVLESRDDKYKTLLFRGDDGATFSISNSSFRSNWRKVKTDEVDTESVENEEVAETDEVVESEATEEVEEDVPEEMKEFEPAKNFDGVTPEEAIAQFVEAVMPTRQTSVLNEPGCISVLVDDVTILQIRPIDDNKFNLAMLPDLFTLTDWRGKLNTNTIQYKVGADKYLGVIIDTKQSCIPEILDIIEETAKDINVYGYTVEEDCEEETNEEG